MTNSELNQAYATDSHVDDDHSVPSVPKMDSWHMATSILVGISKALRQAEQERAAILEEHNGNSLAPGLMRLGHITEALLDARKTLGPDLRNIARSNALKMPEGA